MPSPIPATTSTSSNTRSSPSPPPSSAKDRLAAISSHLNPRKTMTTTTTMHSNSSFDAVPMAPTDPLFGLMAEYKADTDKYKVDLGVGAYRDDNAKPWVLPVVKKADAIMRDDPELNHEYLPIAGLQSFTSAAARLILGADSPAIREQRVSSVQTISGTGAVHLGAAFLARFYPRPQNQPVYLSSPTWANHHQIFSNVKLPLANYPYYHPPTRGLDFEGFSSTLESAPEGSVILLHACAHNPTGVDPTRDQWIALAEIMKRKHLFPLFDCAYQGFASGDLDNDAWAIRYFVEQGFELCIAQSFSKNLGLYGERAGVFHFISPDVDHQKRIASQLAIIQRSEISNPPAYGSRVADLAMNRPELFEEWKENLKTMAGRIIECRMKLHQKLKELGTPGDWSHIEKQIGMFSFTGLTEEQVAKLKGEWHIYMTKNGRISMAGLNSKNLDYVAKAIDKVVRETGGPKTD